MRDGIGRVTVRGLLWLALLGTLSQAVAGEVRKVATTTSAGTAFQKGMGAWDVRMSADGAGVTLRDHVLIEDDGPGIGSDAHWLQANRAPTAEVTADALAMKLLMVDRPSADWARLMVPPGVLIELNGKKLPEPASGRYPEIPVDYLQEGENRVVLSAEPGEPVTLKIARREDILENSPERAGDPPRSFYSPDGGDTWEPVDGEYMVRIVLSQYAPEGRLVSPVIEASGSELTAPLPPVSVRSVSVDWDGDVPPETSLQLQVRTGPCPVYDDARWTEWREPGTSVPAGHRYVQWQARLATSDPLKTPVLRSVTMTAEVSAGGTPAWAQKVEVGDVRNDDILYTSIPYAYEDYLHPRLVELREKYKLDDVVAEGKSELEKLVLLRDWVAHQWRYDPPTEHYPAWDAHEILSLKYGFCVQYAIVYMQCCLSMGYTTRFVFGYHPGVMGGHEVCEVWSNELGKWVLMDANANHHFVDPETNRPLSMLETHDRMVTSYYGDKMITPDNKPAGPVGSGEVAICWRRQMEPAETHEDGQELSRWPRYAKWAVIRMMPRNDFYARPHPVPKTQGAHWDYSDFWVWEDAQTPPSYNYRYRYRTGRRADWEWTVNTVRFDALLTDEPGVVRLQLGTVAPNLDTYLVRFGDGEWQPTDETVDWRLKPGRNRVEMRVRNTAGVMGRIAHMELQYTP